jgi:hypothetical protein
VGRTVNVETPGAGPSDCHDDQVRLDEPRRQELRNLVLSTARSAFELVVDYKNSGGSFADHRHVPRFLPGQSGVYRLAEWSSDSQSPVSYTGIFGPEGSDQATHGYDDIPGFAAYAEFVRTQAALRAYLVPSRFGETGGDTVLLIGTAHLPLEIVERHLHTKGWDLDEQVFSDLYDELEMCWLSESLPVELVIPILAIEFETDGFDLTDRCRVERLSTGDQLSRWPGQRMAGEERYVAMASHALVISGWFLDNSESLMWRGLAQPSSQLDELDHFFQALSIISDSPSGFVQVVYRPTGWSSGYVADLPEILSGPLVPGRRSVRLNADVINPLDSLDESRVHNLVAAYRELQTKPKYALAVQRLISAERRTDQDDRIVDLCVGLESLVSDSSPGDTTYKMALRTAAVLANAHVAQPSRFVGQMKRVYAHRSDIVHGRTANKNATISVGQQTMLTEDFARKILRRLLQSRLENPEQDDKAIDANIIGSALDTYAAAAGEVTPDSAWLT